MMIKDICIGNIYRHKTSSIGYAQAVSILPPKVGANTTTKTLVKCAWATNPKFDVCLFKYFKPADLTPYIVNRE